MRRLRLFFIFMFLAGLLKVPVFAGDHIRSTPPELAASTANLSVTSIDLLTSSDHTNGGGFSCNNSSFYMRVRSTGYKIVMHQTQAALDGSFWAVGELSNVTSGAKEGFIIHLDNNGNFLSQNVLRVNNVAVTVLDLRINAKAEITIAGLVAGNNSAFVANLTASLVAKWVETINFSSQPVDASLHLMEQGIFALAVQTTLGVSCFHLDAAGAIILTRQVVSPGLVRLLGYASMVSGGNGLVTLHVRNGSYETEVTSISESGSFVSAHILGDNSEEYKAVSMASYSLRMGIVCIKKKSTGLFTIERDIVYNSGKIETRHEYQVAGNYDFNSTGAISNSGDGFCIGSPLTGKLLLIKQIRDYSTTVQYAREYNVPVGSTVNALTKAYDGGYLVGLNSIDSSEFILIKTDSSGALKGCGFKVLPVTSAETLNLSNTSTANGFTNASFTATAAFVSMPASSFSSNFNCNTIDCPPAPLPDTCQDTYFKTLLSNSKVDLLADECIMRNNNLLFSSGKLDDLMEEPVQRRGLKLFDEGGHYIKGIYLENTVGTNATYSRMKKISDSTILYATVTYVGSEPYISFRVFSDNLDLISAVTFKAPPNFKIYSGGVVIGDIHMDQEGNFYLCGTTFAFAPFEATLTVCKVSPAGNPLWVKSNNIIGGDVLLDVSMTSTATSLIFVMEGGSSGSVSARMDKLTGQLINVYKYQNSGGGSIYQRLLKYDQGKIFYAGQNANSNLVIGLFDTTARPYKLTTIAGITGTRAADAKNGRMYISAMNYNTLNGILMSADTGLNILFTKEYPRVNSDISLVLSDAGYVYTVGWYIYGQEINYNSPFIKKYGRKGEMGLCSSTQITPAATDINLNTVALSSTAFPLGPLTPVPAFPLIIQPDDFGHAISSVVCASAPLCNRIDVSGPTSVCQLLADYTYPYSKNNGCNVLPEVIADKNLVQVKSITDTSIVLRFLKTGSTWIKTIIKTGCAEFKDSILVQVQNGRGFSLGNDTAICNNSKLLLDAGQGFSSYLWQDGSSTQTFTVNKAGQYHVKTTNVCGEILSDTINILNVVVPTLFIGNDTSICRGNTLILSSPTGYASYHWTSNGNSISNNSQFPLTVNSDQQITIHVTTLEGCVANDTALVLMKQARPVNLGNDSSFCMDKTLALNAGDGYSNYLWSTGNNGSTINVNEAGTYWIAATDTNGCIARDSMTVANIYLLPQVNLGNDFNVCLNENKQLDAGSFATYVWQDNSRNRYFTAAELGKYFVRVTNQYNCAASDTIELKKIIPLPANFLSGKDSICSYEKLELRSNTPFRQYLWSTGSNQPVITVSVPGRYTLTGTDNNGCKGTDTLNVYPKDCMMGIFIPNSFTPNKDGINDVFKATVFGVMESFSMKIYNRYGQLIFAADNYSTGWDGKLQGLDQNTGGFVWICNYKFAGQLPKTEKGSVLLIR